MWGARFLLARIFGARMFGATGSAVPSVAPSGRLSTREGLTLRASPAFATTAEEGLVLRACEG